ncbi:TetR family transcriptional regulator [Sphingopyxis sp. 113P3]|nr:TetR family transcriptional regulator [Sphingopyxis sp. 113P3]
MTIRAKSAAAAPRPLDGRRARSATSRRRIVAAMLTLIEAGDPMPSAARVAEEAGVGLRTVFRHFDDMDSLYSEISATIAERVMPIVTAPYDEADWRENLRDLTQRRIRVFETMLPFRLAANIKRYQSPFLMAEYSRVVRLERDLVLRLLPDSVQTDRIRVEALIAALSFQTWRALRRDQALTREDAGSVLTHMVAALIAAMPRF